MKDANHHTLPFLLVVGWYFTLSLVLAFNGKECSVLVSPLFSSNFFMVRVVRVFSMFRMNTWQRSLDKSGWRFNENVRSRAYEGTIDSYLSNHSP